jgi:hypothetical protein
MFNATEAKRKGIPENERRSYMYVSKGAKSNHSSRDFGTKIYKQNSVAFNNATADFPASNIVALSHFVPQPGIRLSDDERDKILKDIAKGEYRSDPQANGDLVKMIADVAAQDVSADTRKQIGALLKRWEAAGYIAKGTAYIGRLKKSRPVWIVGPNKPPPRRWTIARRMRTDLITPPRTVRGGTAHWHSDRYGRAERCGGVCLRLPSIRRFNVVISGRFGAEIAAF